MTAGVVAVLSIINAQGVPLSDAKVTGITEQGLTAEVLKDGQPFSVNVDFNTAPAPVQGDTSIFHETEPSINQESQHIDYLKNPSINILDKDYPITYLGKGQQTLVFDINYDGKDQVLKIPFTKSGPLINQRRIDEAISKGLLVPEVSIDFDESTIKNLKEYRPVVKFNEQNFTKM